MRGCFALLVLTLAGCGGHGGSSRGSSASATNVGKGRAILNVRWPARAAGRLIPNAANSIVVKLTLGTTVVIKTIPRPAAGQTTTSTTLTGLKYGTHAVAVGGFPSADGSGVAQASGAGSITVAEDAPGALAVAMGSTVASLSISPAAPSLNTAVSAPLTASATDATGAIVLLAAGGGSESLTWTSDAPAVATVAGTGPIATLTTLRAGMANVTAALKVDDAGDVVRSAPVSVTVAPTLAIGPSDVQTILTSSQGGFFDLPQFGLRDGLRRNSPSSSFNARWQALFPLSGVPAGATIQSATLTTSISSTVNPTLLHGVTAYPSASGALTTASPAGTTSLGTLSGDLGPKTVDATAALEACLSNGSTYAGIVVSTTPSTTAWAIWTAPALTITYTLP